MPTLLKCKRKFGVIRVGLVEKLTPSRFLTSPLDFPVVFALIFAPCTVTVLLYIIPVTPKSNGQNTH
jgi:hypothetical protein